MCSSRGEENREPPHGESREPPHGENRTENLLTGRTENLLTGRTEQRTSSRGEQRTSSQGEQSREPPHGENRGNIDVSYLELNPRPPVCGAAVLTSGPYLLTEMFLHILGQDDVTSEDSRLVFVCVLFVWKSSAHHPGAESLIIEAVCLNVSWLCV